jgi:hypothetical protein
MLFAYTHTTKAQLLSVNVTWNLSKATRRNEKRLSSYTHEASQIPEAPKKPKGKLVGEKERIFFGIEKSMTIQFPLKNLQFHFQIDNRNS